MSLNPQQQAIVDHDPGRHARVLAGPGTGKSFTSVQYLERLTRTHPDLKVQMLTFTRAATAEFALKMGDAELAGLGISPPATVHSFALGILVREPGANIPRPLRIPDSWEAKELVRPDISRLLRRQGYKKATPTVVKELEEEMAAGWETLDPERELYSQTDPALGAAYTGTWNEHRWAFGYVLIGELPYRAVQTIEDHGAEAIDLDLLLVDEYQDLNRADIRLIQLAATLAGVTVIGIGDDDQSIYGFRMAAPNGIREFCNEYQGSADYALTESRRCGRAILVASQTLIASHPGRPVKPPLTPAAGAPEGVYACLRFPTAQAEIAGVARIIASRVANGVDPGDIAVLVRSSQNIWAGMLGPELEKHGIPLASTDWVVDALCNRDLRRALAIAHLAIDDGDSLAWRAIIELTVGLGPAFVDYVYDSRAVNETFGATLLRLYRQGFAGCGPAAARRARQTVADVHAVLDALDVSQPPADDRGWSGWVVDLIGEPVDHEVAELLDLVAGAIPADSGLAGLLAQLEPVGKDLAAATSGGVRMMTMAQSKGLTVNTAITLGVEDGIIPMPRAADPSEELRLLYVAMTRATDMCLLTWSRRRTGPTARMGTPRVNQTRNRSPLLSGLPGAAGAVGDGPTFVDAL
jgi:DNA helicase-2/ATP-dependent DNA helicase PcrA